MKKIFNFIILAFLFIPFSVFAEESLEDIHNRISPDNNLTINSIPIEYYKESIFFKNWIGENPTEDMKNNTLSYIYSLIVDSYLSKTGIKTSEFGLYVNSCDLDNNTCNIQVGKDGEYLEETYNITFLGEYNEEVYNKSKDVVNNIKKEYYLTDMEYINQIINFMSEEDYHESVIYNSYKVFKLFPELKSELEKNTNYKYVPVTIGVGGSSLLFGSAGAVIIYDNDVAVNISSDMSYNTIRTVYVEEKNNSTEEDYIKEAEKRIRDYINDESYEIKIEKDIEFIKEFYSDEAKEDVSRYFNYIFNDQKTYYTDAYKLTVNGKEYLLALLPISKENIKKLEVKSKNYKTDISVKTSDSKVPLDTTVNATDVTDKYKENKIIKAFDINLYSDLMEEYIPVIKDGVVVRIPIDETYKEEDIIIYYMKEDGSKGDKYSAKIEEIDGKKYAVFMTNHFSTYVIEKSVVEKEEIKDTISGEEVPNTYDGISNYVFILIISLSGLLVLKKHLN